MPAQDGAMLSERSLREEAEASHHILRQALETISPTSRKPASQRPVVSVSPAHTAPKYQKAAEGLSKYLAYSPDGSHLAALPQGVASMTMDAVAVATLAMGPSVHELVSVLTERVVHLETENSFVMERMGFLKSQIAVLVEENARLYDQLRECVAKELRLVEEASSQDKHTHEARVNEGQVHLQRQLEQTRTKLHAAETRIAQLEASGEKSQLSEQLQSLHRVSEERDELQSSVSQLRARLRETQQRERDAANQIRRAVELVEQTNLERTQLAVQREQIAAELQTAQQRAAGAEEALKRNCAQELDQERSRSQSSHAKLHSQLRQYEADRTVLEARVQRLERENSSLQAELRYLTTSIATLGTPGCTSGAFGRGHTSEHSLLELHLQMDRLRREVGEAVGRTVGKEQKALPGEIPPRHVVDCNGRQLGMLEVHELRSRLAQVEACLEESQRKHGETVLQYEEALSSQSALLDRMRSECALLANGAGKLQQSVQQSRMEQRDMHDKTRRAVMRAAEELKLREEQDRLMAELRQHMVLMDERCHELTCQLTVVDSRHRNTAAQNSLLHSEIQLLRKQFDAESVPMS